jgi:hypothetical protein
VDGDPEWQLQQAFCFLPGERRFFPDQESADRLFSASEPDKSVWDTEGQVLCQPVTTCSRLRNMTDTILRLGGRRTTMHRPGLLSAGADLAGWFKHRILTIKTLNCMKKRIIIGLSLFAGILLGMAACKKSFLNPNPQGTVLQSDYYQNPSRGIERYCGRL